MTIRIREIWRFGQIAADVPQVEMADLIPSSCDHKRGPLFPVGRTPPTPNISQSSVVVTLTVVFLRAKLHFACERPREKREIRALMMEHLRKRSLSAPLTAAQSLIADLFCFSYQHVDAIFAKKTVEYGQVPAGGK